MHVNILTLFPGMVSGPLGESMLKRAQDQSLLTLNVVDIRAYTTDAHRTADDAPYGGGAGMLMKPEPVFAAMEALQRSSIGSLGPVIAPTPRGVRFDFRVAERLAKEPRLTFLCGHYEGMDERIYQRWVTHQYSVGDYVVTGGELPALVMIDAIARFIPGVLGHNQSVVEESFSMGMLEYPQYTRPAEFQGMNVPDVLLSGDHAAIRAWRVEQATRVTQAVRPDLLTDRGGPTKV